MDHRALEGNPWGDPAPEQIAVEAIAALSGALTSNAATEISEESVVEMQSRLQEIGVELHSEMKAVAAADPSPQPRHIRTYCIIFKDQRICVQIPTPIFQTHA